MSVQTRITKLKRHFIAWLVRMCTPVSASVCEMAEMNDLDLRDLAIGRSQIPYFIRACATELDMDR
jgi:uncharacterized protein YjiS (DUF1127 family)